VIHHDAMFFPLLLSFISSLFSNKLKVISYFLQTMALVVHKTLLGLLKLKPLDGTNYRCWSQKLLIFFEQLEVDYVFFFASLKRTTLVKSLLPLVMDQSKTTAELLMRKLRRNLKHTTKRSGGIYWTIWLTPYSICLSPSNLLRSFGTNWTSSIELMTLERRNMWSMNGYVFLLQMASQSWNRFMFMRTYVLKF